VRKVYAKFVARSSSERGKIKLFPGLTKHHTMKTYGGVELYVHALTSALDAGEWSASLHFRFISGERDPDTHWIGGWWDSEPFWTRCEEGKFLPLPGMEPRSSSL
jgi:hypothetical protein